MRCIYLRIEDFVADRIINLCNKQHITMYRLAQISGLKQSTISNIMKRGTLPNLITLEKICIGFGITMSQFFQEKEECLNLTTQQKEIINIWIDLDEEKRELFYNILLGMKNSG
ncbi:MAG: helix-turn-helix domain-containing protein [Eubacterium sp.]|nr:helix-turn-helix domain-containing protein [Eubacterium sp.]